MAKTPRFTVFSVKSATIAWVAGLTAALAFASAPATPPTGGGDGILPWLQEREPLPPIAPPGVRPILWSDCDGDGVHDLDGVWPDCDGNHVVDWCQILESPSLDCDGDFMLDACQLIMRGADCNGNGLLDMCEPQFQLPDFPGDPPESGWPDDCNVDGVSDRLQICRNVDLDCNRDGLLDECQLATGGSGLDCDGDGSLDFCQIASDPSLDCNENLILDRCEIACADFSVSGPKYLGDGDWGRWQVFSEESDCRLIAVNVVFGPVEVMAVLHPGVLVRAKVLQPGQTSPAMLKFIFDCQDCDCEHCERFIDVPLTVQAYDRIELEARAFIPCGLACAFDPLAISFRCFDGDCRDFDCGATPLPSDASSPSSRCMVGIDFSMRLGSTSTSYSSRSASQESSMTVQNSPNDFSRCSVSSVLTVTVPVGDSFTNCDYLSLFQWPPCPATTTPPPPTLTDLSFDAFGEGSMMFVGSPRYKRVRFMMSEADSCVSYSATLDIRGQVGLWQLCNPATGMQQVMYDYWLKHDVFPAFELVYERTSHDSALSGCIKVITPTWGVVGLTLESTTESWGPPHAVNGVWPDFAWSLVVPPTPPWSILP